MELRPGSTTGSWVTQGELLTLCASVSFLRGLMWELNMPGPGLAGRRGTGRGVADQQSPGTCRGTPALWKHQPRCGPWSPTRPPPRCEVSQGVSPGCWPVSWDSGWGAARTQKC